MPCTCSTSQYCEECVALNLEKTNFFKETFHQELINPIRKNSDCYHYAIDRSEFGESYHIASALFLNQELSQQSQGIQIGFDEPSEAQLTFFSTVFSSRTKFFYRKNKTNCKKLSYQNATKIIEEHFSRDEKTSEILYSAFTQVFEKFSEFEDKLLAYLNLKMNPETEKAILFVRRLKNQESSWRNLSPIMLKQVITSFVNQRVQDIILVGDALTQEELNWIGNKVNFIDMRGFEKSKAFINLVGANSIAGQLYLYRMPRDRFTTQFAVGMMSGALDGLAFTGMPVIFFTYGDGRMVDAAKSIPFLHPIHYDKDRVQRERENKRNFSPLELDAFNEKIQEVRNLAEQKISGIISSY